MLVVCSLGCWWMPFCELDGRVLGGMQFGLLVDAVLRAGRVLGGMHFWGAGGCCFASLTAGSRGHAHAALRA